MISSIAANSYTQALGSMERNGRASIPDGLPPAGGVEDQDTVSISTQGRYALLANRLHSSVSGSVSVGSINDDFEAATAQVEGKLQGLYQALGIAPSAKMDISVGYDGHVVVNGESPQADALAEAINSDDELANSIRGMSAMAALLEAARKHQEFAADYAKDPIGAVERYGYLLEDGHDYHVTFSMQDGHIDTKVEYV